MSSFGAARRYLYLMTSCGFASLLLSQTVSFATFVACMVALAISYRLRRSPEDRPRAIRRVFSTGLHWIAIAAVVSVFVHQRLFDALLFFTICEAIRLLFADETTTTYYKSVLLALLQLVVAATGTESLGFGIAIVCFAACGSMALAVLTFQQDDGTCSSLIGWRGRKELRRCAPEAQNDTGRTWSGLTQLIFGVSVLILLCTILLFFVIPRYGAGYLFPTGSLRTRIGAFSDSVNLGATGTLIRSENIVMRVELVGDTHDLPADLRWRGAGLDYFDGNRWTQSSGPPRKLSTLRRGFQETEYFLDRSTSRRQRILTQRVYVENDAMTLFGLGRVRSVRARLHKLECSTEDTLRGEFPDYTTRRYVVISDTYRPAPADLRRQRRPMPQYILDRYLQLPPSLDPQVRELARSIVGNAASTSMYDKVARVEEYLSTKYSYYLAEDVSSVSAHPLEEFLFKSKKGHCEHFAAALVVLLRTLGIPSRLVNGYMQGSYSTIGSYYLIRDSNAHSWAEVYFPDAGWLEFDATPAASVDEPSRFAIPEWLSLYLDAIVMAWRRNVVEYEALDQAEYVRVILRFFGWLHLSGRRPPNQRAAAPNQPVPPVLIFLFVVAALLVISIATLNRRTRAGLDETVDLGDAEFYRTLLESLARVGEKKGAHLTPLEFSTQLGSKFPDLEVEMEVLTRLYYRVRFGGYKGAGADRDKIDGCLQRIRHVTSARPTGRHAEK